MTPYFWLSLAIIVVGFVISMFRILREYERGVIFMLGRYYRVKGPGLILVVPDGEGGPAHPGTGCTHPGCDLPG